MKAREFLLNVDLFIQSVLFFGTLAASILLVFTSFKNSIGLIVPIFFLGMWQLLSGIVLAFLLEDKKRAGYSMGSIFYLVIIVSFTLLMSVSNDIIKNLLFYTFYVFIPLRIAYWYLNLTNETIKRLRTRIFIPKGMEEILDSDEIFESKKI